MTWIKNKFINYHFDELSIKHKMVPNIGKLSKGENERSIYTNNSTHSKMAGIVRMLFYKQGDRIVTLPH